jgi:hypothetical protein
MAGQGRTMQWFRFQLRRAAGEIEERRYAFPGPDEAIRQARLAAADLIDETDPHLPIGWRMDILDEAGAVLASIGFDPTLGRLLDSGSDAG